MSREVPEWIGANDDTPIPKRVKLRVLLKYQGRCYKTGHKFRPGDPIEFDHVIALCNGGENREGNIAPILGGKPHKAKTADDVAEKARVDSIRAKHLGVRARPKRGLSRPPGAKFDWARGRYVRGEQP